MKSQKNSDSEYVLKINKTQAQVLSLACEVLARVGIGQIRSALEQMPVRKLGNQEYSQYHSDLDTIGYMLSKWNKGNVDGYRSSISICGDASHEAKVAWELYQTIMNRLSWDRAYEDGIVKPGEARKWPEMFGVNYDDPMPLTQEKPAKMEKI